MATTEAHYTQTTPTDNNKWTFSCWVKKAKPSSEMSLFGAWSDGNNQSKCRLMTNGTIEFIEYQSSSTVGKLTTNRILRDPAAWMHIVCVYDSDNGTPADRMKMYINGVRETSFSVDTNPSSGLASINNVSGRVMYVGRDFDGGYWQGCMSHVQFVDGSALAPTEFGEVDSTSGIWKIKTGAYATPGNNGFFLKMEDRTNLDLDSSSNAHTFTTAGTLTATYDNPSNNFPTLNVLNYATSANYTITNGNLHKGSTPTSNLWRATYATLGVSSGKWYFEQRITGDESGDLKNFITGIGDADQMNNETSGHYKFTNDSRCYGYFGQSGNKFNNGSDSAYGNTWGAVDDVVGCAFDLDNGKIYWSVNGTWQNSGDPTSGATGTGSAYDLASGYTYLPSFNIHYSASHFDVNFGNGYFGTTLITSPEADDAGIGAFKYDVPAGYYALCTKNIKAYGG